MCLIVKLGDKTAETCQELADMIGCDFDNLSNEYGGLHQSDCLCNTDINVAIQPFGFRVISTSGPNSDPFYCEIEIASCQR